jgi:hypothetical protein
MAATLCPVCGKAFRRLDRHLARHAGTGTTAAALRALQQAQPPGITREHVCIPGCDFALEFGAPGLYSTYQPRGAVAVLIDAPTYLARVVAAFGTREAAEEAWAAHREEMLGQEREPGGRAYAWWAFEHPGFRWQDWQGPAGVVVEGFEDCATLRYLAAHGLLADSEVDQLQREAGTDIDPDGRRIAAVREGQAQAEPA